MKTDELKEFFCIDASAYDETKHFQVVRPASLSNPKNNAVFFVTEGFMKYWEKVLTVEELLSGRRINLFLNNLQKNTLLSFQKNRVTALPSFFMKIM